MTLNQYKACVKAPDDLIAELKRIIGEICSDYDEGNTLEELDFTYNNKKYSLLEIGSDPWEDGGKYQYGGNSYQLVSYDDTIVKYCCKKSIIDYYDIEIYRPCSRTGSYYSDYYYSYNLPVVYRVGTKVIPEQIIPAYTQVVLEEI